MGNPERNPFKDLDVDLSSEDAFESAAACPYCPTQGGTWKIHDTTRREENFTWDAQCKLFDHHDLSRGYLTSSDFFIPTAFFRIRQRRCDSAESSFENCDHGRLWALVNHSAELVAGVEDMVMKIRHSAYEISSSKLRRSIDTPALIKFSNGTIFDIPCFDKYYPCPELKGHSSAEVQHPCGYPSNPVTGNQDDTTCFFNSRGDYISVEKLLRAAGVTEMTEVDRITGVTMAMNIEWNNIDLFWVWPFGIRPQYTYSVVQQPFSMHDRVNDYQVEVISANERVLTRSAGILLQVDLKGQFGRVSVLTLVYTIVLSAGILTISDALIKYGLLWIYDKMGYTYVEKMYQFYSTDRSLEEKEFRNQLNEGITAEKLDQEDLSLRNSMLRE